MSDYTFENGYFVIKNYDKKKPFTDFLPGIAGVKGKPIWLFYANRGQAITSFGVKDKAGCMLEFSPASIAYERVAVQGFRTFLRIQNKVYEPFSVSSTGKKTMYLSQEEVMIEEKNEKTGIQVCVRYFSLPKENYPALVREVTITNTKEEQEIEIYDGLSELLPYGLSSADQKSCGNLFRAWMEVVDLEKNVPQYHLKSSTGDSSSVEAVSSSFFFRASADKGETFRIVDPDLIFDYDTSLIEAMGIKKYGFDGLKKRKQVTQNRLPCAFLANKVHLDKGESIQLYEVYGFNESGKSIEYEPISPAWLEEKRAQNKELLREITQEIETHTSHKIFDGYVQQCYLDNLLRGGYPYRFGGKTHYIYSRKHGDPERDYNWFVVKPEFASFGEGNFRDVLQNRRNDLFFHPEIGGENIRYFFSLLQLDGYNPLVVDGVAYCYEGEEIEGWDKNKLQYFTLSDLYRMKPDLTEEEASNLFTHSRPVYLAKTGEGYWCDHFVYLLDLLKNFEKVFPEKMEELWKEECYPYFYRDYIKIPLEKRFILTPKGVRRRDYIDEKANHDQRALLEGIKEQWVTLHQETYYTTLASKMFSLIVMKTASLDPYGMGLDMDGGKPGWNDALNGLPSLFGSSVADLSELYALAEYFYSYQEKFGDALKLLKPQADFARKLDKVLSLPAEERYGKCLQFKEDLRKKSIQHQSEVEAFKNEDVLRLMRKILRVLKKGYVRASTYAKDGVTPTYFRYEVKEYEVLFEENGTTYVLPKTFVPTPLPLFAEGVAKSFALPFASHKKQYYGYLKGEGYDHKLKWIRVSESLEKETMEIGRIRSFVPGWLERESCFLHMDYKFLLGLLKAGLYKEFYQQMRTNLVPFFSPEKYGRSTLENCSFLATSNFCDESKIGQGFQARLSGANAEFLSMWYWMFVGKESFFVNEQGTLCFRFAPILDDSFFDEKGEVTYRLFSKIPVTIRNPKRIPCYLGKVQRMQYEDETGVHQVEGDTLVGPLAYAFRDYKIKNIVVEINQ